MKLNSRLRIKKISLNNRNNCMDSNKKSSNSLLGGVSKTTIIGGAIIFLTLLVCLYFSFLASITSNANKKGLKESNVKPEYINVNFSPVQYTKTSTDGGQSFVNILDSKKDEYRSNILSVDNEGFITLSEDKVYRIAYRVRLKNLGNSNRYVALKVRTQESEEQDGKTLSSTVIFYTSGSLLNESRGGGSNTFLYDTTGMSLKQRKIRPRITILLTSDTGDTFEFVASEGASVFTVNEIK